MAQHIHTLIDIGDKLWVLSTIECPDLCHIEYIFLIVARNGAIYVENFMAHLEQSIA